MEPTSNIKDKTWIILRFLVQLDQECFMIRLDQKALLVCFIWPSFAKPRNLLCTNKTTKYQPNTVFNGPQINLIACLLALMQLGIGSSAKMGADKSAKNTQNAPKFSAQIVSPSPKVWELSMVGHTDYGCAMKPIQPINENSYRISANSFRP